MGGRQPISVVEARSINDGSAVTSHGQPAAVLCSMLSTGGSAGLQDDPTPHTDFISLLSAVRTHISVWNIEMGTLQNQSGQIFVSWL